MGEWGSEQKMRKMVHMWYNVMIKSTKDLKTVFSQLIERADVMCGSSHGNGVGEEQRQQSGKGASRGHFSLCFMCHCVHTCVVM